VRRWLWVLALYSPAVVLVVAGLVVQIVFPASSGLTSCCGPPGTTCFCPLEKAGPTGPNPGILLWCAAAIYAVAAFLLNFLRGRMSRRLSPTLQVL